MSTEPNRQPAQPPLRPAVIPPPSRSPAVWLLVGSLALSTVATAGALVLAVTVDQFSADSAIGVEFKWPDPLVSAAAPATTPTESVPVAVPPPPALPANAEFAFAVNLDDDLFLAVGPVLGAEGSSREAKRAALPRFSELEIYGEAPDPYGLAAPLPADQVPAELAGWNGASVALDSGCVATVDGFSLVAQLSGSSDYAMDMPASPTHSDLVDYLLDNGTVFVAANLRGCSEARYGRHVQAGPMPRALTVTDRALGQAARDSFLFDSAASREAQRQWQDEMHQSGRWWKSGLARFETKVLEHPRTGARAILIHAVSEFGCGGFDVNIWALYGVTADGKLSPILAPRDSDGVVEIEDIIDRDGDGHFEFVGQRFLGDRVAVATDGAVLNLLPIPFYGCPC